MEISLFASIILFSKDKEIFLALSVSEQQDVIFTVGNKNLSNELLKVQRHPHSLPILSLMLFFLVKSILAIKQQFLFPKPYEYSCIVFLRSWRM